MCIYCLISCAFLSNDCEMLIVAMLKLEENKMIWFLKNNLSICQECSSCRDKHCFENQGKLMIKSKILLIISTVYFFTHLCHAPRTWCNTSWPRSWTFKSVEVWDLSVQWRLCETRSLTAIILTNKYINFLRELLFFASYVFYQIFSLKKECYHLSLYY